MASGRPAAAAAGGGGSPRKAGGGGEYDHVFKLLLVGDASVGKSSLTMRYLSGRFDDALLSTIGIDYNAKDVQREGRRIRLQCWDTAGQERFQSLTTAYYRGCHGVVIVYDVTDRASYQHVARWLDDIQRHSRNSAIIRVLVGNKTDLPGRKVTADEAAALATGKGLGLIETSAKTGDGVAELFETMIDLIYEQQKGLAPAPAGGVSLGGDGGSGGAAGRKKCCA